MTSREAQIQKYDRQARMGLPYHCRLLRDELLPLIPRTPEDGDQPDIFMSKPRGHRAAWSCLWSTRKGIISPLSWYPLEHCTTGQIAMESLDYFYSRGYTDRAVVVMARDFLLPFLTGDRDINIVAHFEAWCNALRPLRGGMAALEFVWPFGEFVPVFGGDPLREHVLHNLRLRPGWGDKEDVIKIAGGDREEFVYDERK